MELFTNTASAPPKAPPRPHVVLLPSPGAGHLTPMAELARRLVELGFSATIVTFTNLSAPVDADRLTPCLPASVAVAALPAVQMDDLPANVHDGAVLGELLRRSLPNIRALLRSINSTTLLAAVVPDFLCSMALHIAAELGVPGYLFFPSNLAMVALTRHIVELHEGAAPGEYRDVAVPLELPGGVSLCGADIPDAFRGSFTNQRYAKLVELVRSYRLADGILVNTFYEMELGTAEAFKRLEQAAGTFLFPPVFPVGPFVRRPDPDEAAAGASSPCLEWLDRQPVGSVVYVAFGSGGVLSVEQTAELAAGLEASGQRFLWVVRMPSTDGGGDDEDDPLAWLPVGFLERTRGRGLAVAAWAPQVRVLSHRATAVFVSHCGWNSTLESVGCGVPMLAWPLYAEQGMNAVILEEKLGVALRVPAAREDDRCLVTRHEIATAVKELVEGDQKLRRRAESLQKAAAGAWSPEGPSRRALEEVAVKLKAALGREK
ncbi:hydroquinone glucosyltransferase-like [Triticum dicoccoides]|uniref:hydroquinone glucosyltransferase-like n=1 Tax=Triticum dicoccoides TaxID=85692 RepID=UPI00188FFE38|nr:hydroquinone glucosyltransferase-like [Triticum dicoccoides]